MLSEADYSKGRLGAPPFGNGAVSPAAPPQGMIAETIDKLRGDRDILGECQAILSAALEQRFGLGSAAEVAKSRGDTAPGHPTQESELQSVCMEIYTLCTSISEDLRIFMRRL